MLFKLKRVVVFIIYILSIAIFQIPTANALVSEADIIAVDTGGVFYKQGCTPNESTDAGFAGNNNVETAFNFFNGRQGISAAQSAGIVGNFMRESGPELNTSALNLDGSASFGIAQWFGGRKAGLINYARSQGKEATDIMVQLDYVMVELNGGYNKSVLVPLLKTTTPEEAAILWENKYEISKDEVGDAGMAKRINYANDVFKLYGNNSPGSTPLSNCQPAPGGGGGGGGGGVVAGDTSNLTCPAGTIDKNIGDGYAGGKLYKIRLCDAGGIIVNAQIAANVLALLNKSSSDGLKLTGGGFRTMKEQEAARARNGCGAPTNPSSDCTGHPVARPGYSNHQMGLAIDFNNCSTKSTACHIWLKGNAATYGLFNLPSEPWHWSVDGR